jgi:hypothetical protein
MSFLEVVAVVAAIVGVGLIGLFFFGGRWLE